MKKEIKRINPVSVAKIYGLIMASLGLIFGVVVGFIMFFIGTFTGTDNNFDIYFGPTLGIAGFISMPLLFGFLGFLFGLLSAFIYNMLALWVGGIIIDLNDINNE